ncbi:hypothetical protein KBX37_02915 [Micromonospora sp. U56]|uniref:hypothetical protein n=1 Tax=Micromonospora sp. U56 TaxID=2824900 RepID=UPI001B37FDFA|nr:hypothetical protein [Micromonospora sp. U56]MBQ0892058.1 hypothetical protein [Micromonospora sp. U56]
MAEENPELMTMFRNAIRRVRQAAVKHHDEDLHQAASEISYAVCTVRRGRGQPCLEPEDMFDCPICGAHPGQYCISTPGHPVEGQPFHLERQHQWEKE